jgi:recombination protein RecR
MYEGPVQDLITELGRLPGVGPKSAQRIAYHLLKVPKEDALALANAVAVAKDKVRFCDVCHNLSEAPLCTICNDNRRDATVVCVVEEPRDIIALERTGGFSGRYHVLGGAINPMEGIGPDQLKVSELLDRIESDGIAEVILCTNPNLEGEATAMYLAGLLKHVALNEQHWFGYVLHDRPLPEPFASADWDSDIDWELTTAVQDSPDELHRLMDDAVRTADANIAEAHAAGGPDHPSLAEIAVKRSSMSRRTGSMSGVPGTVSSFSDMTAIWRASCSTVVSGDSTRWASCSTRCEMVSIWPEMSGT